MERASIYIVDDDRDSRDSMAALVESMGLNAHVFDSAESLLADFAPHRPACLLTDLRMPGLSGLDLQQKLVERKCTIPVILVSGYATVRTTLSAMRTGAVTVLEKPYREQELSDAINEAIEQDRQQLAAQAEQEELRSLMDKLTAKERQVLDLITQGMPNKAVAKSLSVSERTIEDRRRSIMVKLHVKSFAGLMELALKARDLQAGES
jgi:RNA polymerase sigma factor (sigma-70 family)